MEPRRAEPPRIGHLPPPPLPELHILIGVYLPQQYGYPNERNFYHQFVNNRIGGKRIAQAVIGQYAY